MTLSRAMLWRVVAIAVWMFSMGCLGRAVQDGAAAAVFMHSAHVDLSIVAIPPENPVAEHWAILGWLLQFVAAATLAAGIEVNRVARKIFIALGILIAADGSLLLCVALMVR